MSTSVYFRTTFLSDGHLVVAFEQVIFKVQRGSITSFFEILCSLLPLKHLPKLQVFVCSGRGYGLSIGRQGCIEDSSVMATKICDFVEGWIGPNR